MIPRIESGISGLDDLLLDEKTGFKGIPENTATLVYGPPKTGKSIFCYQFMYHGLLRDEPCLCLLTDYGIKQLQQRTMDFEWYIQTYIQNEMLYIIDTLSRIAGVKVEDTNTIKSTSLNNLTDIMVKLGVGTRFLFGKSTKFRSILSSLTTPFIFNPEPLVVRFLKAYIKRVKEAGGTAIITHTEGTINAEIENEIKSLVDNVISMDGEHVTIKTSIKREIKAPYKINSKGMIVLE